jgi:hypothetical protein
VTFTSFAEDLAAARVPRVNSVYLTDLATGALRMIAAVPGRPAPTASSHGAVLSPDGAHLAFTSTAQNLVPAENNHADDVFVLDRSGARYPSAATRPTAPVVPPRTTSDSGPPGTVGAGEQRFVLPADTDPVRFQGRFDAGHWHWCGARVKSRVRPGAHTFWARAVDSAGNVDLAPAARIFRARAGPH